MSALQIADGTHFAKSCLLCGAPHLVVRTNKATGQQFAGCPNYPDCTYTCGIPQEAIMRLLGQPTLFPPDDHTVKRREP